MHFLIFCIGYTKYWNSTPSAFLMYWIFDIEREFNLICVSFYVYCISLFVVTCFCDINFLCLHQKGVDRSVSLHRAHNVKAMMRCYICIDIVWFIVFASEQHILQVNGHDWFHLHGIRRTVRNGKQANMERQIYINTIN